MPPFARTTTTTKPAECRLDRSVDRLLDAVDDIRRAGEDAQALLQANPDVLMRLDVEGVVRLSNAAVFDLLGLNADDVLTRNVTEFVLPEDAGSVHRAMAEADGCNRPVWATVRLCPPYDVWVEIAFRKVGPQGRHPAGFVASIRDKTAHMEEMQRLAEARDGAFAASQAKSQFLAGMSHELRTPLNAIIGFSEVMSKQMFGAIHEPHYCEYVQLIHESGEHLLELINGVLDLSKIEAGKFEIHPEPVALVLAIEESLRFVKLSAERLRIALTMSIADGMPDVYADHRALRQCLINLLANAIKFTPDGGAVSVTAALVDGGVEIAVSDTGIGISAEDLAHLGTPYVQARTRSGEEGTGLGLSLVKALVALHGGNVAIESAPGKGTKVRMRFPNAISGTSDGVRTPANTAAQPLRGAA